MRVTATADFTAVIQGGQMLNVRKGDVLKGDVAAYLLDTGAAVEPVEAEEFVEVVDTGNGDSPEPEALDVSGKIDDIAAWVGDDAGRAREALDAEQAKGDKARPRLVAKLTELLA